MGLGKTLWPAGFLDRRSPAQQVKAHIEALLCYVHVAKDELEERRSHGGNFVNNLVDDLGSFAWSAFSTSEFASPAHIFLHDMHFYSTISAPIRRFVVRGIMSDHTPIFFRRQMNDKDTFVAIEYIKEATELYYVTGKRYPDMLINVLLRVIEEIPETRPRAISAGYALVDELIGYAFGQQKLTAVTVQRMPDVTQLMSMVALHCNSKRDILRQFPGAGPAEITLISSLIEILFKLMPYRCNNREYFRLLEKTVKTGDPLLLEFITKVLAASWLGIYEHCRVKAKVGVRLEVYRFLRNVNRERLAEFFTAERSIVSMYMFKEYFCELCRRWPGFKEALPMCNWKAYFDCTREIGDNDIRAPGSIAHGFLGLPTLPSRANLAHDDYRKWQIHAVVDYDLKLILKTFDDVAFATYPYHTCTFRPGEEHLMPDPRPLLPKARLDIMRDCVSVLQTSKPDFPWLLCFGASWNYIMKMRVAVLGKLPDLDRLLNDIARKDEVSFSVFYSFFYLLSQHLAYETFPCDQHMLVSQTLAIARHYGLADGDRIPDTAACFHVCTNCGDVKRQSFYRKDRKTPATGFGKTRINLDGGLVCARKSKEADWQDIHFHEHGKHPEASLISRQRAALTVGKPSALRRKFAKHAAKQHVLHRCIKTPLLKINALGCVAKYAGISYVACYSCAKVVSIYELRYHGEKMLCSRCLVVESKKEKIKVEGCVICGAFRNGRMRTFYLYDDYAPLGNSFHRPSVREVNICASHNPMNWVIPEEMVFLSRVLYRIFNNYGQNRDYGGPSVSTDCMPVPNSVLETFLKPTQVPQYHDTTENEDENDFDSDDDEDEDEEEEEEDDNDDDGR